MQYASLGQLLQQLRRDLRAGQAGILGSVSSTARRSFIGTYLQILRSPIRATVELAEDPTYRQHVSFLLTGLAMFCVIMVPFLMQSADPSGEMGRFSESMQTLMKVLSQTGVYFGAIITFVLGYLAFRAFAKTERNLNQYLKLYCLAYGFMLPPYAAYDYVARGVLKSTGLSSFSQVAPTVE